MKIVVIGGGVGFALLEALVRRPLVENIIATCHRNPPQAEHSRVTWQRLDLTDEDAIRDWAKNWMRLTG